MSPDALRIRQELPADVAGIRRVNRLAFGGDDEAQLVDALRDEGYVQLSLVAVTGGEVVGHVLFSTLPIMMDHGIKNALALAPLAVLPDWQRQGIGSELVRRGLDRCREQGHQIVIVLGHSHFYPRLGFSSKLAQPLLSPFAGEEWMATELVVGALDGIVGRVQYPRPFGLV